ncbi:DDRGK domain-containing protein 1-like [Macrobrachium rosenbergii]|uniref:DDRGK domain-containing protein 1-like n=1 Tax=Macrobrachium rosenbergii TaxID=79674 RepID=UPI0034D6D3F4
MVKGSNLFGALAWYRTSDLGQAIARPYAWAEAIKGPKRAQVSLTRSSDLDGGGHMLRRLLPQPPPPIDRRPLLCLSTTWPVSLLNEKREEAERLAQEKREAERKEKEAERLAQEKREEAERLAQEKREEAERKEEEAERLAQERREAMEREEKGKQRAHELELLQ